MGGDTDRAVEAEATGPPPAQHIVGLGAGQQPPTHVQPEDAALSSGREAARSLSVESAGQMKGQAAVVPPDEQPIGDGQVEVGIGVEGRPEAA